MEQTENKYYIPEISEFHVGFEFEIEEYSIKRHCHYDWCYSLNPQLFVNGKIRVKYLDIEDIKSLDWSYTGKSVDIWFRKDGYFDMGNWTAYTCIMHYGLHDNRMRIFMLDSSNKDEYQIFVGKIKNKSELKVLMQQLGIDGKTENAE